MQHLLRNIRRLPGWPGGSTIRTLLLRGTVAAGLLPCVRLLLGLIPLLRELLRVMSLLSLVLLLRRSTVSAGLLAVALLRPRRWERAGLISRARRGSIAALLARRRPVTALLALLMRQTYLLLRRRDGRALWRCLRRSDMGISNRLRGCCVTACGS